VRYWTVEEARAYLPRLRQLVALVQGAVVAGPEPGMLVIRAGAEHAEAALAELEEHGLILRQLQAGLVDFPARRDDDRMYLLCWKVDEPDIQWWHWPADGFAGRQPLG
jgi:hypothetical protein